MISFLFIKNMEIWKTETVSPEGDQNCLHRSSVKHRSKWFLCFCLKSTKNTQNVSKNTQKWRKTNKKHLKVSEKLSNRSISVRTSDRDCSDFDLCCEVLLRPLKVRYLTLISGVFYFYSSNSKNSVCWLDFEPKSALRRSERFQQFF